MVLSLLYVSLLESRYHVDEKTLEYKVPSSKDLIRKFEQLSDFGKNVLCQIAIKLLVEEKLYNEYKKNSCNITMINCNAK